MYAPPPVSATGSIQHVECVVDAGLRQKVRLVSLAPRLGSVTDAADRCISQGWRVKCEKAGIRRVLMNLIGNALKFTSVRSLISVTVISRILLNNPFFPF
jgi:signal transduction histidine kinase